ncbi:MAG: SWIM zinc finger family protein [Anaerolineae bacterium]
MSRYDYYSYFPTSRPIETDEGIKARSQRGQFGKNWWATRWISALEKLLDSGRLSRGRSYARKGQVLAIKEELGGVTAKVQGSSRRPYTVSIDLTHLRDEQWDKVIAQMAEQAIFTAQLLAGEMPPEIDSVFRAAGVSLFPDKKTELHTECSCPDWANPCKHVAAVHFILGEQFDEDPFLLFRLRGRTQEQVLAALRQLRAEGGDSDEEEVDDEPRTAPLPVSPAEFWQPAELLDGLRVAIKPPPTPLPLLKRLGQPNFVDEDLQRLLGPAYHAISKMAIAAAFGQEEGDSSK